MNDLNSSVANFIKSASAAIADGTEAKFILSRILAQTDAWSHFHGSTGGGEGRSMCWFCDGLGKVDDPSTINHKPDCVIAEAQALLAGNGKAIVPQHDSEFS